MKNSKTRIMFIMCIAMAIMAIGYAYFATNLDITSTGNITTNWNVNFISITEGSNGGTTGSNASTPTYTGTTATMSANLQVPGDYMEYDLVLKNSGNVNAIIEDINAVATGSPAIIFSISGLNEGDELAGGDSKTIKIKIEYDSSVTSQPTDTTKTLTVSIKAVQDTGQTITNQSPSINQPTYLSSSILRDNVAQADTNIDFSEVSSDTNGKGLYYTSTNTENNAATYYFRGDVNNNYVKFGTQTKNTCTYEGVDVAYMGDETVYDLTREQCESTAVCSISGQYYVGLEEELCVDMFEGTYTGNGAIYTENVTIDRLWRIVRINEDGSIRLITNDNVESGTSFNAEVDDNAYVGYMYGSTGQSGKNAYELTHENTNNSYIKDYLDEWYEDNLNNYASLISAETGFCNDRSIAPSAGLWFSSDTALGYGTNVTYYGSYNRLINLKKPQFACPNEERDLFTISTSSKGNKALAHSIGLLTVDEAIYAGGVVEKYNDSMYLANGNGFWTMSPTNFDGTSSDGFYAFGWCISEWDYLDDLAVFDSSVGVRPVVNLKSTVEVSTKLPEGCTKLDGTEACPYIIKTN